MECPVMNDHVMQTDFGKARIDEMRSTLADCASSSSDAPRGLPGHFYTDVTFFEHERQTVLRRGWHCVGRVDEFAERGDYQR